MSLSERPLSFAGSKGRGATACLPAKAVSFGMMDLLLCGDRQVVELDDGVGLRPEPDSAGILESVVGRIENLLLVEPDDEVVPGGIDLQRVPGVLGDFDRLVLESPPAAGDGVVDATV